MGDTPHAAGAQSPERSGSVAQPTRGAEHNQQALDNSAEQTQPAELLPTLDDGITLLEIDDGRGVEILQSLVLDHLLLHDGPAFWIDARGFATTTSLSRLTPSHRLLDRIHVARGFTPYQHYGIVSDLPDAVDQHVQRGQRASDEYGSEREPRSDQSPATTPSLIVSPALDYYYRDADSLDEFHARTLQARSLARLSAYMDDYDCPVLVTRTTSDAFSAAIETAADHTLRVEQTRMGPRFVGDDFETLLYPVGDGAYYQTTISYWQHLLGARAVQVEINPSTPSPNVGSVSAVGTGVTADGSTASLTANPLLDAWNNADAGGGL